MPFLTGENFLKHPASRWILISHVANHFPVTFDGDTFSKQIFGDHLLEIAAFDLLDMTAFMLAIESKVGFTLQLNDVHDQRVGVLHFRRCVLQKP